MAAIACRTSSSRPSVPRRALLLVGAIVLLFGVATGLHAWLSPRLPHKILRGGGEFRVFAIRYGADSDAQAYLRAPKWKFRVWEALPKKLQKIIPYPEIGPQSQFYEQPAVAIWCAWIEPETHKPEINEVGKVTVALDNGETLPRERSTESYRSANPPPFSTEWPVPNGEYRVIWIVDPPRDSRHFRGEIENVWGETAGEAVRFTIDNPAYRQP